MAQKLKVPSVYARLRPGMDKLIVFNTMLQGKKLDFVILYI